MRIAVGAADRRATRGDVDGCHDRAEMDFCAMATVLRQQKIDEGAVTAGDAVLRAPFPAHPLIPKRQRTGPLGIGRVVAFDHPLDRMPQPGVFWAVATPP